MTLAPPFAGQTALLVSRHPFMTQGDGAATVIRHWFDTLSGLGFAVTVLGFDFRDHRWSAAERAALQSAGAAAFIVPWSGAAPGTTWRRLLSLGLPLITGQRFVPERWAVPAASRSMLDEAIGAAPFDVAVFNGVDTLHMAGAARLRGLPGVRLLDLHDLMPQRIVQLQRAVLRQLRQGARPQRSDLLQALAWPWERRMARAETRMIAAADLVCCASDQEMQTLRSWSVDPGVLRRIWWPIAVRPGPSGPAASFELGLLASDALFNTQGLASFLRDVWPIVRARRPGCRLAIAGSICRELKAASLPAGVFPLGWIDDVASFYRDVAVVIVPLRSGTGVSIKTLEAAAYGAAIVSTPIGARGLDLLEGAEIRVAVEPANYAQRCLELLANPVEAAAMGRAAQRRVRTGHSPPAFAARVTQLIREAATRRPT